ncbi:MAG: polysaccharide deacetylase family protein [Sulfuricurvum sp.]|nr:polysaccharide deacetylase family protein [Sulfuricurvum sp.]
MKIRLFFTLFLIFTSSLVADTNGIYDIRGSSPQLDANLTSFLDKWRSDTVTPIQEGNYTNVIVNGNTTQKTVTLTFDDAPDENNTYKLLDILSSHGVQAAFFMIAGTMNDTNISVVQQTHRDGHLVLNHSFNHPRMSDLNESAMGSQLDHAAMRIETITGKYPLLFRPPYGSINPLVVNTINARGMTTVLWSLDSLDWTLKDPDAVVQNVVSNVRNGDIILMHRNPTSVASLSSLIEKLIAMDYAFIRLDTMLGIQAYKQ